MAAYIPIVSTSPVWVENWKLYHRKQERESNSPTEAQQDDRPDSKGIIDFYKELDIGDAKEVDLNTEIRWHAHEGNWREGASR